jgi:hypothetical protein
MAREKRPQEQMSPEDAKAFRASLYKEPKKAMSEKERRMQFKIFWAKEKAKYKKSRSLEEILWLHLKATKRDEPGQFEDGLRHFGLKKNK